MSNAGWDVFDDWGNKVGEIRQKADGIGCGTIILMTIITILLLPILIVVGSAVFVFEYFEIWQIVLSIAATGLTLIIHGTREFLLAREFCDYQFFKIWISLFISSLIVSCLSVCLLGGFESEILIYSVVFASALSFTGSLVSTVLFLILFKIMSNGSSRTDYTFAADARTDDSSGDWFCVCGTKNSVNYGMCKKCGEYRSAVRTKRNELAKKVNTVLRQKNVVQSDGVNWLCECGTKNSVNYGQCKRCARYRAVDIEEE